MPQYSESETMSTDDDTAEFLQYRKYKYGRAYQSSMSLLEEMGKAEVNDEPWLKNSWVIGDEARPISRQRKQLKEIRGICPFTIGYPKVTYNGGKNAKNTVSAPTNAQASRPTRHRPEPEIGRMFGLGGTTPLQPPRSESQRPLRSTQANRTTRPQGPRAQGVRNAISNTPRDRTRHTPRPSARKTTQHGAQSSRSARSQNNGVSNSDTPSSVEERSGQVGGSHNQDLGGLESRFSSAVAVSVPITVPDEAKNANSRLQDTPDSKVQIGVEIEFLVALETDSKGEPREQKLADRYYIPLDQRRATTIVDGIPARNYISQLLRGAGIPAVSDHDYREEVRQAAACFKGPLDVEDEYAVWNIKCEPACMAISDLDTGVFDYVGLEFATRKLQANAQGFQEIRSAICLLRRHVLVATSEHCGTHIHVDAATLSLQERKHFVCLYLLAERELFSLTAPHRQFCNDFCGPICTMARLAEDAGDILRERGGVGEDGQPPTAQKMVAMKALILECASTEELQTALEKNMLPPFHRAALYLKNVGDQSYTFEFRHFQTSLDPEVIELFVRLCVALVMAAKGLGESGTPSFNEVYEDFGKIKDWRDLLITIGLKSSLDSWTKLLSTYPSAPEDGSSASSRMEGVVRPSVLPPLDCPQVAQL